MRYVSRCKKKMKGRGLPFFSGGRSFAWQISINMIPTTSDLNWAICSAGRRCRRLNRRSRRFLDPPSCLVVVSAIVVGFLRMNLRLGWSLSPIRGVPPRSDDSLGDSSSDSSKDAGFSCSWSISSKGIAPAPAPARPVSEDDEAETAVSWCHTISQVCSIAEKGIESSMDEPCAFFTKRPTLKLISPLPPPLLSSPPSPPPSSVSVLFWLLIAATAIEEVVVDFAFRRNLNLRRCLGVVCIGYHLIYK